VATASGNSERLRETLAEVGSELENAQASLESTVVWQRVQRRDALLAKLAGLKDYGRWFRIPGPQRDQFLTEAERLVERLQPQAPEETPAAPSGESAGETDADAEWAAILRIFEEAAQRMQAKGGRFVLLHTGRPPRLGQKEQE
jgi:hypothetical protein